MNGKMIEDMFKTTKRPSFFFHVHSLDNNLYTMYESDRPLLVIFKAYFVVLLWVIYTRIFSRHFVFSFPVMTKLSTR